MATIHATTILLLRNNHYYNHNPITILRHRFSDHDPSTVRGAHEGLCRAGRACGCGPTMPRTSYPARRTAPPRCRDGRRASLDQTGSPPADHVRARASVYESERQRVSSRSKRGPAALRDRGWLCACMTRLQAWACVDGRLQPTCSLPSDLGRS